MYRRAKLLVVSLLLLIMLLCILACEKHANPQFIGYNIPHYFEEHILGKESIINEILLNESIASSFIFFTDAHWEINSRLSSEIIRHIHGTTGIGKVFFGGDAITGGSNKQQALEIANQFSSAFLWIKDFYPVVGNHDTNSSNQSNPAAVFSKEETFDYLHGRLASSKCVNYDDFFHYCVNDELNKTVYICLDNGCVPAEESISYLGDVLAEVHDKHIAIFTHIVFDAQNYFDKSTLYLSDSSRGIIELADAYNGRQKLIAENGKEYDYTNADSKIEFIMSGHIHRDHIQYSVRRIPLIALDCDCRFTYSEIGHTPGTINEQCITVVMTDYSINQLHMIRIGRGEDMVVLL